VAISPAQASAITRHRCVNSDSRHSITHDRKIEYMMQDFTRRGLLQEEITPIIYRIFWHYGIYVIPPYFSSFWQLIFFQGTMYGIIFSLIA
jgi:hypothetical protein